jgi:hypothetical protein
MHPYERWITRRYLATALKSRRDQGGRPNEYLRAWTGAHGCSLGVPPFKYKSDSGLGSEYDSPAGKLKFQAEWKRWRTATLASAVEPKPPNSSLQKRIDWLGDIFDLNPSQRFLLGLFARIARVQQVRNLVNAINKQQGSEQFDYSELRSVLDKQVNRRDVSEHGLLTRLGLIEKDDVDEAARHAAVPGSSSRQAGGRLAGLG